MTDTPRSPSSASAATIEHHDVIIVGAGLSGIGAGAHLRTQCPDKRFVILEAREAIGGTWDLFRYPGLRSDSDMYTFGYAFKPWTGGKTIADGNAIKQYIEETVAEYGLAQHLRMGHRVLSASWSSLDARWTLDVEYGPTRERKRLSCNFLNTCAGYYDYAQAHRPAFTGEANYQGALVHPQFWPESLSYAGKRVVVIGSGATAVTLVPEMAKTAAHVTMLQRSPTYVVAMPAKDGAAKLLGKSVLAYRLMRTKYILMSMVLYKLSRRWPEGVKGLLVKEAAKQLQPGYDVATHFTPSYKPWDQRMCVVPDGDMFETIRQGRASVVTDQIDTFTEHGIRLQSGAELQADVIVTATGLRMCMAGNIALKVDGTPVAFRDKLTYKGMMFDGVPNYINTVGYTNAAWTLKADLTARYMCRLLKYMDRHQQAVASPEIDASVQAEPLLDLSSGYVQRARDLLPQQGHKLPWRLYQNYALDWLMLRLGRMDDGVLRFGKRETATPVVAPV